VNGHADTDRAAIAATIMALQNVGSTLHAHYKTRTLAS